MLAYFLTYMPTLALTNSISFHHLDDPAQQVPAIRVAGTIGWSVAGFLVGALCIAGKSIFHPDQFGFHHENPFGLHLNLDFGQQLEAKYKIEATSIPMQLAGVAQVILGVFCLFLPHTPPSQRESKSIGDVLGLDALALMKQWSFLVFVVGSFLICIPLQFYYTFTQSIFQ